MFSVLVKYNGILLIVLATTPNYTDFTQVQRLRCTHL